MDDETTQGYIAGIVSLIISATLFIIVGNAGTSDVSGQLVLVFALLFAVLSGGSFYNPKTIGKITHEFLKNIIRNFEERERRQHHKQTQYKTRNSNQAGRDVINNYYGSHKRKRRRSRR